jgi:hypothetical protein
LHPAWSNGVCYGVHKISQLFPLICARWIQLTCQCPTSTYFNNIIPCRLISRKQFLLLGFQQSLVSSVILTRLIQYDHCNPSTGFDTVKNQHTNGYLILVLYAMTLCSLFGSCHGKLLPDRTVSKGKTSRFVQSAYTLQYLFILFIYLSIYLSVYLFIYLEGCTMFPHFPAPIQQIYNPLPPVPSVIPVFFH